MKFNEHIAISTSRVLLVPYEARHVPRYHTWMKDPEIQELTASEPLSLEEEYENQEEWRAGGDKLTFIVCMPREATHEPTVDGISDAKATPDAKGTRGGGEVRVGVDDAEGRMLGDINLFIYPDHGDSDSNPDSAPEKETARVFGEVDVMIASPPHRNNGYGKAAVKSLLTFVQRNLPGILAEYAASTGHVGPVEMERLVAKIKERNEASKVLFGGLGFVAAGGVNYFGEVEMVLEGFGEGKVGWEVEGYEQVAYSG